MARYYVVRRGGQIVGLYGAPQPGEPIEVLDDTAPEIAARFEPPASAKKRDAYAEAFDADDVAAALEVLEAVVIQIEAMRAELGAKAAPRFTAVAAKLAAIAAQRAARRQE